MDATDAHARSGASRPPSPSLPLHSPPRSRGLSHTVRSAAPAQPWAHQEGGAAGSGGRRWRRCSGWLKQLRSRRKTDERVGGVRIVSLSSRSASYRPHSRAKFLHLLLIQPSLLLCTILRRLVLLLSLLSVALLSRLPFPARLRSGQLEQLHATLLLRVVRKAVLRRMQSRAQL
jgi:hypothetical protein